MSHNNTLTNAKKKHYLIIRSLFSSGWTLALILRQIQLYSACLPETNSNVSREERSGFVCCWASTWARGSRGYLHMNARGRDRIRNNELDGTDWTSCWFHTDYFITECLFSIRLTSFQSRHFQLSIDITPMSVCCFRWVTVHFSDVFQRAARGDGEDKERILFVFFFFTKTTKFCCIRECTQKKIDTSKFQLMYNTYLLCLFKYF